MVCYCYSPYIADDITFDLRLLRQALHHVAQDDPLFLALCRLTRPHYQLNPGTNWPGAPDNVAMESSVNPISIEMRYPETQEPCTRLTR